MTADDIDALYRSHARAMVTFFGQRTFDADAAVDLVAETFAVAIACRATCRAADVDERAAWLYGIARNQLHGWYRRGAIERRALERVGLERPPLVDADVERIEELAGLREQRRRVAALLERLPVDARTAVRMRVVEERSYSEMARTLGVSEQTIRARVSRGLRSLAGSLGVEVETGTARGGTATGAGHV
ncbi:MAG: RNA polymerase sigma factor [Solirubrobacteraceae bacterium]|nr:RNA polymerase sigma factor [Solirubrobacteraceae bacterium]